MGDRLATIDMDRKVGGGCCAPFRGGAGSLCSTMSPGPRHASVPSGILIHPTVCAQYTNVTDRQDRQRSRSIWRQVTCNGRPKIDQHLATLLARVQWHVFYSSGNSRFFLRCPVFIMLSLQTGVCRTLSFSAKNEPHSSIITIPKCPLASARALNY